jgi:hypothetical protein
MLDELPRRVNRHPAAPGASEAQRIGAMPELTKPETRFRFAHLKRWRENRHAPQACSRRS